MFILTGTKLDERGNFDNSTVWICYKSRYTNEGASEKELMETKIYANQVIIICMTLEWITDLSLVHSLKDCSIQQIYIMCQVSILSAKGSFIHSFNKCLLSPYYVPSTDVVGCSSE